jgi:hypothetical protein
LLDARIRASLGQMGIEVMTASDFFHASRAIPGAIDQARMIVALRSVLRLPRLAHSVGGVRLGVRCSGTSVPFAGPQP